MKLVKDMLTFQDLEAAVSILETYKDKVLRDMPSTSRLVDQVISSLLSTLTVLDCEMAAFELSRQQHEDEGEYLKSLEQITEQ